MHLETLVVTVGRPARIGDLTDLAACGLEQHRGGVDVAGLADLRVNQSRTDGIDLDRLLGEEEAGHVEVVDHHVTEDAARGGYVAGWRWIGVAREDSDDLNLADGAGAQTPLQLGEARIKTAIEAYHQGNAALLHHIEAGLDAGR